MCQVDKDTVENKTATDSKEHRGYSRDDPVWTEAKLPVQPNQKMEIGSKIAPTQAGGSWYSGLIFQFPLYCLDWYFHFQ